MLFNKPRAQQYLQQYNLDALVATSPANITYFTDYFCWLDPLFKDYMTVPGASSEIGQRYAVFPASGDPALVVGEIMAINGADLWVHDLHTFGATGLDTSLPSSGPTAAWTDGERRLYELVQQAPRHANPTAALVDILRSRGLTEATIGVEMDGLSIINRAALRNALPRATFKDASNLIRLIRAVKSRDEIALLTRAAEISEVAGLESLALARPGRRMADLIGHYRARIAEMGADFDHYAFGIHGMGIATEPDYVLSEDEATYLDWGCLYQHYFSDTGTTLALRPLSPALSDRRTALRDCVDAALDQMRPGVKVSVAQTAMQQLLAQRGITMSAPHGHGLGVEVRDYPIIVADNGLRIKDDVIDVPSDLPFEEDMVVNLEAGIFMPGVASLHIERTFIITSNGVRPLIAQDRSSPFIPESL